MVLRSGISKQNLAGNNKPLAEVVEPRTSLALLDFTGQTGRRNWDNRPWWWNWQTRSVQGAMTIRSWEFNSPPGQIKTAASRHRRDGGNPVGVRILFPAPRYKYETLGAERRSRPIYTEGRSHLRHQLINK